jgi:hypothetical protein
MRTPRISEPSDLVPLTFLVPGKTKARLILDAERTGRSVGWLVRQMLEDHMAPLNAAPVIAQVKARFPEGTFVEPTLEEIP